MNIGHLLKLIRTNKGMNQVEMAHLLGISQNYLSLIESGRKEPSDEKIAGFAKYLKTSKEALIFSTAEIPKELKDKDREDFIRLQQNIISLLLFQLSGSMTAHV